MVPFRRNQGALSTPCQVWLPWHQIRGYGARSHGSSCCSSLLGLIPYGEAQVGLTQSETMDLAKLSLAKGILAGRQTLLPSML